MYFLASYSFSISSLFLFILLRSGGEESPIERDSDSVRKLKKEKLRSSNSEDTKEWNRKLRDEEEDKEEEMNNEESPIERDSDSVRKLKKEKLRSSDSEDTKEWNRKVGDEEEDKEEEMNNEESPIEQDSDSVRKFKKEKLRSSDSEDTKEWNRKFRDEEEDKEEEMNKMKRKRDEIEKEYEARKYTNLMLNSTTISLLCTVILGFGLGV